MFGINREKQDAQARYLCLDVGTEFLKIISFGISEENIIIDEYLKHRQHTAAMKSGTITSIRRVIENVKETVDKLETKKFDGVVMGIAGELVKGVMVEARYDRTDPSKPIDHSEITLVAGKITNEAHKEARNLVFNQIGEAEGETTNIEMLNYIVVDALMDGFRVEDPIGMTGKEAKIKIYFTFAPVVHVNYLKSITDSLGGKLLGIVPQPFAVARAINGARESNYSAIIIDVGGGTTDVAVIQNGVIMGTQMAAFGGRVFTKRISNDLRLSLEEAEDFKVKYTNKDLMQTRSQEVRESVGKDIPLWSSTIAIELEEFIDVVTGFPNKMYLCGGGSLLPEIKESLIEYPWKKELPFNRSPHVAYLTPADLYGIIDEKQLLKSADDVTPASIAKFAQELLQTDHG